MWFTVETRVYSFILILNIEHLMEISEFFTSGLNEANTALPPPRNPKTVSTCALMVILKKFVPVI